MLLGINKILVPTDFSETSMAALEYAAFVAKKLDADITLLHVIELYEHNTALRGNKTLNDIILKGVKTKLDDIIQKNKYLKDIKILTKSKQGKIYKEIDNVANDGNFDMIIMGTHGASGIRELKRVMLGTNSYRVMHNANCPVLTIRKGKKVIKFKSVVLPLDITKETKQKVKWAIEWAKVFGATLHVVSVSRFIDEFIVDINSLKFQLHEVARKIKAADVPCTTKMIRHNDIADSILKHSKNMNADLTIIMTRQERKMNELWLGSSSKSIINDSLRPVLTLRPKKK